MVRLGKYEYGDDGRSHPDREEDAHVLFNCTLVEDFKGCVCGGGGEVWRLVGSSRIFNCGPKNKQQRMGRR